MSLRKCVKFETESELQEIYWHSSYGFQKMHHTYLKVRLLPPHIEMDIRNEDHPNPKYDIFLKIWQPFIEYMKTLPLTAVESL